MSSADDDARSLSALLSQRGLPEALVARVLALIEEGSDAGHSDAGQSGTRPSVDRPSLGDDDTQAPASRPSLTDDTVTLFARPPRDGRPLVPTSIDRRASTRPGKRLEQVVLLASGGMGEIHRVHDGRLDRYLAMKVLHAQFMETERMRSRFFEEAQVTAQLAHPSIPPVHEIGELEDGRPYFTMKEVHGQTLAQLIEGLHTEGGHQAWSERRRLEIFQRVSEAVAYAHARGVVHCDLKPLNVMVGAFGEVLVMDWGVAMLVPPVGESTERPVTTTSGAEIPTVVAGTPAYMPPEQAGGELARLGPAADVYALGVMLYELLSGERPYRGSPAQMLFKAVEGRPPPLPARPGSIVDEALFAIIERAMAPEPGDRFLSAGPMAEELARWSEGALRREKALGLVREAEHRLADVGPIRERARHLSEHAQSALAALAPDARVADKVAAWAAEDEAAELLRRADLETLEVVQLLQGALVHAPSLPEARGALARLHFERHKDAEARRDADLAARQEILLRAYDVGEHASYLAGTATLDLTTDLPCRARLLRYVASGRRLAPERVRDLGETPLVDLRLPVGSYLLDLYREDRPAIRYPVLLRRLDGWRATRPGEDGPTLLELPPAGAVARGEVLVAAGWFLHGDARTGGKGLERAWVDGFVVQERPVTFADLARFLLSPEGAEHRAQVLRDGLDVWRPDWPAVGLSWRAARAFAAWHADQTGLPWRLPSELEWEKAARGVDGRDYPWGDFADGSFCHVRAGDRLPRAPVGVMAFPTDQSPYGMAGAGGNVRDWCADAASRGGPPIEGELAMGAQPGGEDAPRIARGGSWRLGLEASHVTSRVALPPDLGFLDVGLRLARSV